LRLVFQVEADGCIVATFHPRGSAPIVTQPRKPCTSASDIARCKRRSLTSTT
jgi:hypothetical protein